MMEADRPFLRFGNPTLWGIAATLLVTISAVCLSYQQTCATEVAGVKICQTKLAYLKTAPPNEVGDALAGVAGVLAFIWIIVTVALQAEELRAQREELKLTRQELGEQRQATQDMAKAMQSQLIILEIERLRSERAEVEVLLNEKLLRVKNLFRLMPSHLRWKASDAAESEFIHLLNQSNWNDDGDLGSFFFSVFHDLGHSVPFLRKVNASKIDIEDLPDPTYLHRTKVILEECIKIADDTSTILAERATGFGLRGISVYIDEALNMKIWGFRKELSQS